MEKDYFFKDDARIGTASTKKDKNNNYLNLTATEMLELKERRSAKFTVNLP